MVKVLCVDQYANIGGAQRSLIDLLPAFSRRGWQPSVAAPDGGPFADIAKRNGYPVHHLNCGSYTSVRKPPREILRYAWGLVDLAKSLDRLILRYKFNLLYVNGPRLLPPAAWVARRRGLSLIFHCHNRLLQPAAIALIGRSLQLPDSHLIGCCEYAAFPFKRYIPAPRFSILFNGVQDMNTGPKRPRDGLRRIGIVGRVDAEKGQLEFVQAAAQVSQCFRECRFFVVGGPMFSGVDYYRRVAACSNGLPVSFLDWQDDVARVYSDLDLLVVPSCVTEATTRVILEAYSAGVPVVAFPSGGIPEVLRDGETGFLSDDVSAEALARRIISVLQMDRTCLANVVERARKEWADRYTVEAYREGVCGVLARAAA